MSIERMFYDTIVPWGVPEVNCWVYDDSDIFSDTLTHPVMRPGREFNL